MESAYDIRSFLSMECWNAFFNAGVKNSLFQWQGECLSVPGVLDGKNLIIHAPTGSGKSLVSEIIMVRRVIKTQKICIFVLPSIALCTEKSKDFTKILKPLNKTVQNLYGNLFTKDLIKSDTGVVICTIERANILASFLIEEKLINKISMIVVDELHMINNNQRGYLLELLLTKFKYCFKFNNSNESYENQTEYQSPLQIIGMSATLANGLDISKWLHAALYETNFRPIPLKKYLKVGNVIKDEHLNIVRTLNYSSEWLEKDPDLVALLTKETVDKGNSVLIFCSSRKSCESTAKHISKLLEIPEKLTTFNCQDKRSRAMTSAKLYNITKGSRQDLSEVVSKGVAYHHAGLSMEERDIIKAAYTHGLISVIAATSTLAVGVNLPARTVIFKEPYLGTSENILDPSSFNQMCGRAGRDSNGEAILIANKKVDIKKLEQLIVSKPLHVFSCLSEDKNGMYRILLEAIASEAVATPVDIVYFIRSSLLAAMNDFQYVASAAKTSLHWLDKNEFIKWECKDTNCMDDGYWRATQFGKATTVAGFDTKDAILLREDLVRAQRGLVMSSDLHITYLITPLRPNINVSWEKYWNILNSLSEVNSKVSMTIGIDPAFIQKRLSRREYCNEDNKYKRFFAALILYDLIQEFSLNELSKKYEIAIGLIEGLQESTLRFSNLVSAFCGRMGWTYLESLISCFECKIVNITMPMISELTKVPFIKTHRAKIFYKAGLRTVEAIAAIGSVDKIALILMSGSKDDQPIIARRAARQILEAATRIVHSKKNHPVC